MTELELLKEQLAWWELYGDYIGVYYPNQDAEACSYADGDYED